MTDEIQLALADGSTCTVRRECLVISQASFADSPWNWLLVVPVLFYCSMPWFFTVPLVVMVILLECNGVEALASFGRAEFLVAALLVLWLVGLLGNWLANRKRIKRDKVVDARFQEDACILKIESRELTLRFVDPKAAQEAFTSLGWEPLQ